MVLPTELRHLKSLSNCCLAPKSIIKSDNKVEIIMNKSLDKLQSYDLLTLHSRIYKPLLSVVYGIKNNKNSPIELKEQIVQNTPLTSTNESISTEQSQSVQEPYNLRNRPKEINIIHKVKYELLTIGYFSPKLFKTFSNFDLIFPLA